MLKCPNLCEKGREQWNLPLCLRNLITLPSFLTVTYRKVVLINPPYTATENLSPMIRTACVELENGS
jgi:hypothetical protein